MRRNSTSSVGALHPVLFFLFIYGISLVLAIFVCRTVYYSMNKETAGTTTTESKSETAYTNSSTTLTAALK
jgi:hypothetical protein